MANRLWLRFFFPLITVSLIALSAALLLRILMVRDFREYREGEREDRVYWITAAMEGSYDKNSGWEQKDVIENAVWALMLGFESRVVDRNGTVIVDTDRAVNSLSPLVQKRIAALTESDDRSGTGPFMPYPLFLGGEEIGYLEVRFLTPANEHFYVARSDRLLLFSSIIVGCVAIMFAIFFSRRLARPLHQLTEAAVGIGEGNLKNRVPVTGHDEISRLADAFNRMAQSLERHDSLRRKVTANLAHELRTPLTTLRGELEGMMDGLIPVDREHLQSLHEELGRFRKLIEGLEALAQAEASALYLKKGRFLLRPFLQGIAGRFSRNAEERGISLSVDCPEDLMLEADPDRISQVIINLLSNALRATAVDGTVRIRALRQGDAVIIETGDTGKGIPADELPQIFERFYRGPDGGLGIGLAIVRELVEAHGGSITVTSEPGSGSLFTVRLPQ
jgi:two-component system sensor histidine kinase BaeS